MSEKIISENTTHENKTNEHITNEHITNGKTAQLSTISLFGISVSKLDMDETVDYIIEAIRQHKAHQVVTINPIMIMAALEQPEFMQIMKEAELVVPDGTGVVWAARYKGTPVAERVAGIDLLHKLMATGEQFGWRVYLLGASPEVNAEAATKLQQLYPGIQIVGNRHGYFTPKQDDEVVAHIAAAKPQLLFVASQLDRQEPWIYRYREQLNIPVMMGVGGSFDVITGHVKRAPLFFQKLHLEWFYRLLREPHRALRMLALPKFVIRVMRSRGKDL